MGDITALGYVGLTGPVEEWQEIADVLGLQTAAPSSSSEARFRVDERAWRLAVQPGEPGIGYIGWEVASRAALTRVVRSSFSRNVTLIRVPGGITPAAFSTFATSFPVISMEKSSSSVPT